MSNEKESQDFHKENLELLPVEENPRLPEGLPEGPPDEENPRLPEGLPDEGLPEGPPDEENLRLPERLPEEGFKEFEEGSSDEELYGSDEQYHKKNEKKYCLDDKAIKLGEDLHKILHFIHKLPACPPTRDKMVFPRNELYRQAIIDHLMDDSEFSLLKGFQQIDDFANNLIVTDIDITSSTHTRVPFITNDEKSIKDVLHKLVGHIFNSVRGSTKSKVAKDIL
jgi:hypothetical protein